MSKRIYSVSDDSFDCQSQEIADLNAAISYLTGVREAILGGEAAAYSNEDEDLEIQSILWQSVTETRTVSGDSQPVESEEEEDDMEDLYYFEDLPPPEVNNNQPIVDSTPEALSSVVGVNLMTSAPMPSPMSPEVEIYYSDDSLTMSAPTESNSPYTVSGQQEAEHSSTAPIQQDDDFEESEPLMTFVNRYEKRLERYYGNEWSSIKKNLYELWEP